jgi:anti-sigma factor RsiW
MKKKFLDLLYLSFDGLLSENEQRQLDQALSGSPQLREEKERLLSLRGTVSASGVGSFQPFFAERVMRAVTAPVEARNGAERFFQSLQLVFRRVAVAGLMAILLLLVYNVVRSGQVSVAGALGMSQETLVEVLESPFDATVEDLL